MAHGQASIQGLLGGLLKNRHMVASMRRVMVMSLWSHVVGDLVAQKSWPEKVADGILTVGVSSHPWAEELHLLKSQILARYRQLLGRSAVKDVEFRVGRRKLRKEDAERVAELALHPAPEEQLPTQPVPGHLFAGVQNPEVRDLLTPMFARLRAQRDWKHEHGWARCATCQRIYHGASCPHCGGGSDAA
ncbi:MAG: DciA family protein [Armatimonadota bacterium]